MCGISGILSDRPIKPGRLEAMTRALAHRGPDGEGFWVNGARRPGDPHLGLGHRRLAIVDLSGAGAQPMTNEDGRLTIVFNGEIYNHEALRRELADRHPFRSRSDTEVLLHGWEEEGSAFLRRLDGMFAFAVWDARDASLTLGRDPVGEKPLLYAQAGGEFLFASEMAALLRDAAVARDIDPEALSHYLAWNAVPAPWTMLRGVRRLGPGRLLRVSRGKIEESIYWTPSPCADPPVHRAEAQSRLRAALERSVALRLRGDVPAGAFLSGGIDSTILAGLAARASAGPLRTFSVGFEGQPAFDERAAAREAARMHGTLHTEIVLDPREALREAEAFLSEIDEPFADSSAIPTSLVSRHTRSEVKVALSGDGADELFAGYWKYVAESFAGPYARLPAALRRRLAALAARMPDDRRTPAGESLRRVRKFLSRFQSDAPSRYVGWMLVFDAAARAEILAHEPDASFPVPEQLVAGLCRASGAPDALGAMLEADLRHTLPTDMLAKVDRMSMRHGLEVRVPYLAPEILSLALAIPARWKLQGTRRKAILIDACADLIPRALRRRPKRGFEIPLAEWLRGDLRPLLEDLLGEASLRRGGLFRPEAVGRLVTEHLDRRADHAARLWGLVVFRAWQDRLGAALPPAGPGGT